MATKAAASAPSSSSPAIPEISCTAPRASPPPGSTRSIAAMPEDTAPYTVAAGRSICRTCSRNADNNSLDMPRERPSQFLVHHLFQRTSPLSTTLGLAARMAADDCPKPPMNHLRAHPVSYPKKYDRGSAMWWWFVLWVVIIWLIFSGGGYYGYRRSYYYDSYGMTGALGILIILFIIFWIVIAFAGPYWGWYGHRWW